MSSRSLLNLALLCVAGILVLVIVYRPGFEPEAAPPALTALSGDTISRIHVTRTAREPLTFIRQADHWTLAGNSDLPANDLQMRSLLAILQAPIARSYPAGGLDLETLGLKPPQATIMLDDIHIDIGTTDAIDKLRYVRTGDNVFLVTDNYQQLINTDWPGFVTRKLLPQDARLTRLQLPDMELSLSADGQWQLSGDAAAISPAALQTLASNWEQASAYYVRRYQQQETSETITLEFSNHTGPLTFSIVTRTPEFVLARPDLGIQYHLQAATGEALLAIPQSSPEAESHAGTP